VGAQRRAREHRGFDLRADRGCDRIPNFCARCCAHFELASIARSGYLEMVIERPENDSDPNCRWLFYKDVDDVPEEFYKRIGAKKPAKQAD
jgi:hypothetical protein